ncbi:hypothetical protein [Haladaptatus sp. NG-SE-30]
MTRLKLKEFQELRRALPVIAATMLVAALAFPMWSITVHAVQYPNEPLYLHLYAYPRIAGDYWEMAELNQYIGFYFPDPVYWTPNFEVHERAIDVPEWSLGPLAFVGVAIATLVVSAAPNTKKLGRGLKWLVVGSVTVFGVMLIDIQYRLYQAGHTLDPDAPMIGVDPFTPPLWGKYEVANLTSYSEFGTGAYMAMVAIGLLVVAYRLRDSNATVSDAPELLSDAIRRLTDRGTKSDSPSAQSERGR